MKIVALSLLAACSIPSKFATDAGPGGGDDGGDAGNTDPAAPTITLTGTPALLGNQTNVTFGFTVDPATALVECRLDSDSFAECDPPSKMFGVIDGAHVFDIKANQDGHIGTSRYAFTVDTAPPALAITSQPANPAPTGAAQFMFTAEAGASVTCQIDTAAPAACTSPVAYSGLADGAHTFTLSGSDSAGNVATKSYAWTVDTSAPSIAITSEPPAYAASTSAQFQFTAVGASNVTCQLDGGGMAACTSPWTYNSLGEGSHSFVLRGVDGAGNSAMQTYTWTVDTVKPIVTMTTTATNPSGSSSGTFTFSANEGTLYCTFGSSYAPCSSPQPYSFADGSYTFKVYAQDAAGNQSIVYAYSWLIDTKPPVVSGLTFHCNDASSFYMTWSASDAGVGITSGTCSYPDTSNPFDCTGLTTFNSNFMGQTAKFMLTYTDALGHANSPPASIVAKWSICGGPP